jgi:hypothetical protein
MSSGAPRDGESFAGAIPCPVRETPPLPLFHLWDLRQPPPAKLAVGPPPAGFTALMSDPDPAVAARAFAAMMEIKRLDVDALRAAARITAGIALRRGNGGAGTAHDAGS